MKRKFSSTILTPNNERIPNHIRRWFIPPRKYEGAGAIVARPGTLIPKVHRDAEVVCKVLWVSDVYFDDNNRPRKDVAFELCRGTIDGVIRITAGEDRIPIFNYLGIDDIVSGQQFYKSLEVKTGAFDQSQSAIIENREGDADTPYYPGLAYFVLKGFKLWKWPNRSIPYMEAVVLRNVEEATADTYADDPTFYNPPSAWQVTSIAGNFDENPDKLYVTSSGIQVYEVTLSTNTWTVISNSANLGGSLVKAFNAMVWFKGNLYCVTQRGLFRYNGTPLDWTTIFNNGGSPVVQGSITVDDSDTLIAWHAPDPVLAEVFTYDGTTVTNTGYDRKDLYQNHSAICIEDITKDIYSMYYKTTTDSAIMKYSGGSWARGTDDMANVVSSRRIHRVNSRSWRTENSNTPEFNLFIKQSEWVPDPSAPGAGDTYIIFDDTAVRLSTLDFFSNRWHVTRTVVGGSQFLYRLETDLSTVTAMPSPSAASAYYTHIVQRVKPGRLFVGCSRGFWEAGDA